MWFEAFVALRYLRGKRKNRFISLITMISIAGVAVGVIALIVVLSVMTGFNIALRDTIIGNRAHVNVIKGVGLTFDEDYRDVMRQIQDAAPEILASGPFIQVQALLEAKTGISAGRARSGAYIIGVDPELESDVTQLRDNLTLTDGRTYGAGKLPGQIIMRLDAADDKAASMIKYDRGEGAAAERGINAQRNVPL